MFAILKAVHYVSLLLLCGGPVFWLTLWQPLYGTSDDPVSTRVAARIHLGVMLGGLLFVLSGLAEAVRAASQVVDPAILEELRVFLSTSRYGQMSLLKAILTPAFVAVFVLTDRRTSTLAMTGVGLIGLGVLCSISLTSHAAARPDTIPLLNDIVHLVAAVIWGGGLLYFASLPWATIGADLSSHIRPLGRLVARFSTLGMLAVLALAATGAVSAFLHVYGPAALTITPYGRTVLGKLVMFGLAVGIAGVHLLLLAPALTRQARCFEPATATRVVRYLRRLVQVEAGLVMSGMLLAGVLTTFSPAERPGHIVPKDWQQRVGTIQMHLEMTPTNDVGGIQFDLLLQRPNGTPVPHDTQVSLAMRMVDHDMGLADLVATPVTPGRYTASGLVSMAGDWQVEVRIQLPQAPLLRTTLDFNAPTGALEIGRVRRFDLAPVTFSRGHALAILLGSLLISLAVGMLWASRRGSIPLWATPVGLLLMVCGGALGLRVVLVDAYPTTYLRNPVPFQEPGVYRGAVLFQIHCATCHGPHGHGDGPAAAGLSPRPADLTAVHVDDHTDGDIFWWLTHGIASTAMPSFDTTLLARERWEVIRYVRSLRHGIPGVAVARPVALWPSAVGAVGAVVLAFAMLGMFVRRAPGGILQCDLLQWPAGRWVAHPLVLGGVRVVTVGLFVTLLIAGLIGRQTPTMNIAPTLVWIIGWVGLVSLGAVYGNLWALLNPWRILYDWAAWGTERVSGVRQATYVPYPRALGVWPGVLLFGAFAWFHLVYEDAAVPVKLSGGLLLYSGLTWSGMFLFGKEVWLRHVDPLSLALRWVSRCAITAGRVTEASQHQWNLRPVAAGLLHDEVLSVSDMLFVLVLLGTIAFDGLLATPLWVEIEAALQEYLPGDGPLQRMLIRTLGLLGMPLFLLECYALMSMCMGLVSGQRIAWTWLARRLTVTLVPIAVAYHLAHYLVFLLVQGQAIIPLLSDPLGWGWDLFGSADYRINFGMVGPRWAWLTTVAVIVVGHIIAVCVAYLVALRIFRAPTLARRSQYPMLAWLVASTMLSLWMLAPPVTDGGTTAVAIPGAPTTAVWRAARGTARLVEPLTVTMLRPGVFVKRCHMLTPDETFSISFQASQPVRFNLHYHRAGRDHFAIAEHLAHAETHTFTPPARQIYCLMWTNVSPQVVELSVQLMRMQRE
jgi:putative copper export protein